MSYSLSDKGAKSIQLLEGFVTKAYRDAVGVLTIGTGFTNRSKVFKQYWIQKHGRGLKPGDTITRQENEMLLRRVVDEEYGKAVNKSIKPKRQHHYDGAASMTFNCGTGAVGWRWAKALAAGDVARCAQLLRNGYNKAGGRVLRGLTKRRKIEADIIENAIYPGTDLKKRAFKAPSKYYDSEELKQYQGYLHKLGHYDGAINGEYDAATRKAVTAFQTNHPNLKVDGILGPATIASLVRAVNADLSSDVGSIGVVVAGILAFVTANLWIFLAAAVVVGALFWFFRDEVEHNIRDMKGNPNA